MGFMDFFWRPEKPGKPEKPPEAAPTAVMCKCPSCGHGVLTMFTVTEGRLKLLRDMPGDTKPAEPEMNGDAAFIQETIRKRREASEARRNSRIYDSDHRPEPGA